MYSTACRHHSDSRRASIASAVPRHARDVVGADLLAGAQHRGEVQLLDGGCGRAGRDERLATVHHREHHVDERHRLLGGAERVAGRQRALLQHSLARQASAQQHHALVPRERAGTHELGDRRQPVGLGQQRAEPATPSRPRGVAVPGVPGTDGFQVAGERAGPAHGRVVAGVGEVAVERPQAPHETLGVRGDRFGEVTARW